jgi:hypothetical protein
MGVYILDNIMYIKVPQELNCPISGVNIDIKKNGIHFFPEIIKH